MLGPAKAMEDAIAVSEAPPEAAIDGNDTQSTAPSHSNEEADQTVSMQANKHSNEPAQALNIEPTEENIIKMLEKVQGILSQTKIRSDQKTNAMQCIGWVINQVRAKGEKPRHSHEEEEEEEEERNHPNEHSARLSNIEKELAEIKKAIIGPPRTYAQAAQRAMSSCTESCKHLAVRPERGARARMEDFKKEKAKREVTLTTRNASNTVKEKLNQGDVTKTIQGVMENTGIDITKIRDAKKMSNHTLKIRCASEHAAEELRALDWKEILEGTDVLEQWSGIVAYGVSKDIIDFERDKPEDIIALIEDGNRGRIKIEKAAPLMKRARNPDAHTQPVLLLTKRPEEADECISGGIKIGHHYYRTERYTPQCQLRQCFNCQAYGHKADICTRNTKCGKCAQEHDTRRCESDIKQCANCGGTHYAWDGACPIRQRRKAQMAAEKDEIPIFFTK